MNELFSYRNLACVLIWASALGLLFSIGAYLFHACQSLNEMQEVMGFIVPVLIAGTIVGVAYMEFNK